MSRWYRGFVVGQATMGACCLLTSFGNPAPVCVAVAVALIFGGTLFGWALAYMRLRGIHRY